MFLQTLVWPGSQPSRGVAMSGVMTMSRLNKLMSNGYGMGRDEQYKSWIRIRRKQSSPVSNLHSMPSPLYKRPLQLLSGLEFAAAHVALWLGANEIREQHPFWPEPHPHPRTGRCWESNHSTLFAPGLLEIAKEAGIKHGVFPGTRIPFVATIDFTLAVGPIQNSRLVHWSCKPRELLDRAPNRNRIRERIQLEMLYSRAVGASHIIIDGTDFTQRLIGNLDWFMPLRSQNKDLDSRDRIEEFSHWFLCVADDSVTNAKHYAAKKMQLDYNEVEKLFRASAWKGYINIDFFEPVIMSRPLSLDTKKRKQQLSIKLLGGLYA